MGESKSLELVKRYLGEEVELEIDRPLGSKHPEYGFRYEANYGFVPNTKAPDGEEIDGYFLGTSGPVKKAKGKCVAIVHRSNNDDDKLIVVSPESENITDEEILKAVRFQEEWFEHEIIRE